MSIRYKFKSEQAWSNIEFDALSMPVGEVKRAILSQRGLEGATDFDLACNEARTGRSLRKDEMVERGSSLIVVRQPVAAQTIFGGVEERVASASSTASGESTDGGGYDMSDMVDFFASEQNHNPFSNAATGVSTGGGGFGGARGQSVASYAPPPRSNRDRASQPLPPGYVCKICGLPGHWIYVCPRKHLPRSEQRVGLPNGGLTHGVLPVVPGKVTSKAPHTGVSPTAAATLQPPALASTGRAASLKAKQQQKQRADAAAKSDTDHVSSAPPSDTSDVDADHARTSSTSKSVPEGLKCPLTKRLLEEPVVVPCCFKTFSRVPLMQRLWKNKKDGHTKETLVGLCPACGNEVHAAQLRANTVVAKQCADFETSQANKNIGVAAASAWGVEKPAPSEPVSSKSSRSRRRTPSRERSRRKRSRSSRRSKRGVTGNVSLSDVMNFAQPGTVAHRVSGGERRSRDRRSHSRQHRSNRRSRSRDRDRREPARERRERDRESRHRESETRHRESETRQRESETRRRESEHRPRESEHRSRESEHRPRESEKRHRESEHRRRESSHKSSHERSTRRSGDKSHERSSRRESSRRERGRSRDRSHRERHHRH
ncbi:MAG: hypothetical protein MHM6MM_004790 [Cercozoa sp. M6MM]